MRGVLTGFIGGTKPGRGYKVEEEKKKMEPITYTNAGRYQVTLVEDKDQVLVRCLVFQILLDTAASSSDGISSIEHVDDDI